MQPKTFGQWLKRLRAEQDLTQEKLAELVGCATPTLRAFEIGARRPSREMAERIADILQVPTERRAEFLRLARLPVERDSDEQPDPVAIGQPSTIHLPVAPPSTLPQAVGPLIGREAERNALRTLLLDEPRPLRARLVTIVGAGGMGKTRLALDLAGTVAGAFAHGVVFVSLAALENARNLPLVLAEALGISLQGVLDLRQHLLTQLSARTLLLVLDNFEHLLAEMEAITWIKEIMQVAPGVQLLITSRERLRISDERTFELGGLTLPAATQPASHLGEYADALMLFLDRARHADSDFVLDASNRAAVVRICQLLGGMPLGIELAAAWVRTLACDEIADEIARNMDFLALADRDVSPRHRNIRAVFEHSWRLLSEPEQRLLPGLAYFRGGCTRQAAEQVAGATLPLLASLIDKSLLARGEGGRFVLHELIRQFAEERLQQEPLRRAQIAQRHATYYADFLQRNQARLESAQQPQAIGEIAAEMENLRLAWAWICAQRDLASMEPFITVLGYYLDVRGLHYEGEALMTQWLQAERMNESAAQISDAQLAKLALLHGARGFAAARNFKPTQAMSDHHHALLLARRSEDSTALFYTTMWAGFFYSTLGDLAQGIPLIEESVQHSREIGRPWCEASATMLLGLAYLLHNDNLAKGYQHLQEAYTQIRSLGDPHLLAICATQLSIAADALGFSYDVRLLMEENLNTSRQRGDRMVTAMWLLRLGVAAQKQGDLTEAEHLLRESIALFGEMSEPWGLSEAYFHLAKTVAEQGKINAAVQAYQAAIDKAHTGQIGRTLINAQLGLAGLWLAEGKIAAAAQLIAQAEKSSHLTPGQTEQIQELRNKITQSSP